MYPCLIIRAVKCTEFLISATRRGETRINGPLTSVPFPLPMDILTGKAAAGKVKKLIYFIHIFKFNSVWLLQNGAGGSVRPGSMCSVAGNASNSVLNRRTSISWEGQGFSPVFVIIINYLEE